MSGFHIQKIKFELNNNKLKITFYCLITMHYTDSTDTLNECNVGTIGYLLMCKVHCGRWIS